ncbi:hypothetical protein [Pseudomonas sp. DE0157]|uniref:hypothetical protein n=1 Tax=Pseudomonas sp. DE0157 TaxID=2584952 RepID=UPI0011A5DAFD|nr:hypothetical protein [Pseudomonas sp. DE0157]
MRAAQAPVDRLLSAFMMERKQKTAISLFADADSTIYLAKCFDLLPKFGHLHRHIPSDSANILQDFPECSFSGYMPLFGSLFGFQHNQHKTSTRLLC